MAYFIAISDGPTLSTDSPAPGADVTVTYTVQNTGDEAPARIFVAFRITNHSDTSVEENAFPIDGLAPGASFDHTETLGTNGNAPADTYTLRLTADPSDTIGGVSGNGQGDTKSATFTTTGS